MGVEIIFIVHAFSTLSQQFLVTYYLVFSYSLLLWSQEAFNHSVVCPLFQHIWHIHFIADHLFQNFFLCLFSSSHFVIFYISVLLLYPLSYNIFWFSPTKYSTVSDFFLLSSLWFIPRKIHQLFSSNIYLFFVILIFSTDNLFIAMSVYTHENLLYLHFVHFKFTSSFSIILTP